MTHAGTTGGSETVLSSVWRSAEMINDGCSDANRQVLIKGVGEHLLPTAQAWRVWRPGLPVSAPDTRNCHLDQFCHLIPGQTLITEVKDLLGEAG